MEGQAVNIGDSKQESDKEAISRSKIKFPYNDLDEAVSVAQAIWQNAGESCSRSQLAAYLNQTTTSGAFRLKVATASNFGFVKSSQGNVELLELGKEINDPSKTEESRAKAFLKIPLYRQLFERFDGSPLPPPAALERVMTEMGVPKKQTDTARQVFHRSATQAGFFKHGTDRLVQPTFKKGGGGDSGGGTFNEKPPGGGEEKATKGSGVANQGGSVNNPPQEVRDPFIQGLLNQLPAVGTNWSASDQAMWLQTAAHIFGLLYKRKEIITVQIEQSTRND